MFRILSFSINKSCIRLYSSSCQKEPLTPLGKHLLDSIKLTGPLSVSHFMRQVLVNPLSGYYMKGDVFGKKGDFITSPEISQIFGELCAVWYLSEWMRLGRPSKTQIIEFGPGRGTLMSDMLRTLSQFNYFYETLTDIHLIEASPELRKIQRERLVKGSKDEDVVRIKGTKDKAPVETITKDGLKISWHDGIEVVPDQWSFVMAHEFFDALPVHLFEKTESEWREILVDIDDTSESKYNFKPIKSPKPTGIVKLLENDRYANFKEGERVEISPDSWGVMDKVAKYLNRNGGTGLVIDYGQDYVQGDTLRAIKNHKIVYPWSDPGNADLSADVDFSFLKEAIRTGSDLIAYGPITQKDFLQSLGIANRVESLFRKAKDSRTRKTILDGAERLVDPNEMGRIYKVLAFAKEENKLETTQAPIGFEKENMK
ncbi:S-adenosyl-L-methionine-dependent methyltransferase [Cokeromyces recurvatus]|uniref:S-adenosyl-L-methionine-dependent methyltransferase n=1 Tax=Cokeromyces recurvatus TaxID=90255 RepID=UPI002220CC91|nr:S-adenosyl-L-methionine-dependent methyltransferase [Cokeromyces recurvatus]KAI7906321.1 S-adenosyl-L-methionine-dependent methyltransferase [Cokeromyces recurvatus]